MSTTVIRVEKNREFVVMSNKFLREKEMSLKAKGLLALCLSLPDTWNYSLNGLCAICKENLTAIRSTLKELEKFGYLKRNKKKNEKGQFVYEYIIYETPQSSPAIENLYMDNQYVEKLPVENNRLLNIDLESIEEENIDNSLYISEHDEIIAKNVTNDNLRVLYQDYVKMRKSINAPLSPRGLKMLITRCENLSHDNVKVQQLLLENAIMNQWKNVYRPKEEEIEAKLDADRNELKKMFGL